MTRIAIHLPQRHLVPSIGVLGDDASALIGAMAEEYAAREGSEFGPAPRTLRALAIGRIRGALSTALQMGLSQRVMSYLAAPQVRGGMDDRGAVPDMVDGAAPGEDL